MNSLSKYFLSLIFLISILDATIGLASNRAALKPIVKAVICPDDTQSIVFTDFWVNGTPVSVVSYKDIHYAHFIAKKFPLIIEIILPETVGKEQIFPVDVCKKLAITGNKLVFSINKPEKIFIQLSSEKLAIIADSDTYLQKKTNEAVNLANYPIDRTGQKLVSPTIQHLIDSLASVGGGKILFPAGKYLIGTISVKSGIYLLLEQGALLQGTTNPADYPVDAGFKEGDSNGENFTFSRLIFFDKVNNCGIIGYGTIDGDGKKLRRNGRNSNLIRIKESNNILIEGVTLRDPAAWNTHILHSENVTLRNIKMFNDLTNANTDGFDPDASVNVLIEDFLTYCSDDCFAVKSTNNSNLLRNTSNIIIRNGLCWTRKSALKVGTETKSEAIGPVLFENICIAHADRAIYLTSRDGAFIHDISFINIQSGFIGGDNDKKLFLMSVKKRNGIGRIENILIKNWQAQMWGESKNSMEGFNEEHQIRNLTIRNLTVGGEKIKNADDRYWTINRFTEKPVFKP